MSLDLFSHMFDYLLLGLGDMNCHLSNFNGLLGVNQFLVSFNNQLRVVLAFGDFEGL